MNWSGPADFLAMGGYGLYVWGSYGMALACLLVETAFVRRRRAAPDEAGIGEAGR